MFAENDTLYSDNEEPASTKNTPPSPAPPPLPVPPWVLKFVNSVSLVVLPTVRFEPA